MSDVNDEAQTPADPAPAKTPFLEDLDRDLLADDPYLLPKEPPHLIRRSDAGAAAGTDFDAG